jgi:hypothetical protein
VTTYLRYLYRRIILLFVPVRAYLLQSSLPPEQVLAKLHELIQHDRLYFLKGGGVAKPYIGRFDGLRYVGVKSDKNPWQRRIKVKGSVKTDGSRTIISLMLSTPLSPFNFLFLGVVYGVLLWWAPRPFKIWWLDGILWLFPLILAYGTTAYSFRKVYRKEKWRFLKTLRAIRIPDSHARKLGF